ncbi:MAG: hypothetical protein ACYCYP_05175 [Leptospirales bacterium]
MKKMILLSFLVVFSIAGCVSVDSSSITGATRGTSGQPIHVTYTGDLGILHLTIPKDLTSNTNKELLALCSSGHISNVQTQLSTRDFLGFVQVYKVRATAVCE